MTRRTDGRTEQMRNAMGIFRERLANPIVRQELGVRAHLLSIVSDMLYVPTVLDGCLVEESNYESMNTIPLVGMYPGEVLISSMVQPLPLQKKLTTLMVIDAWKRQHERYTERDIEGLDKVLSIQSKTLYVPLLGAAQGVTIKPMTLRSYWNPHEETDEEFVSSGRPHIGVLIGRNAYLMADTIAHEASHAVDIALMPGNTESIRLQNERKAVDELTAYATEGAIGYASRKNLPWWHPSVPYNLAAAFIEGVRWKHNGPYSGVRAFEMTDPLKDELQEVGINLSEYQL